MRKEKNENQERKNQVITDLIEMYDIKSGDDIHEALKNILGDTIKNMLMAEMESHLNYSKSERSNVSNSRNGYKKKTVRSHYGELEIDVPQDRESSFEPVIVPKRVKNITNIENQIISMYARGLSTRQISEQVQEIYGFDVSSSFVSDVTDKIIPDIQEWQNRPLDEVYPIVFVDATHFSVRCDKTIKKIAAYIVLGVNLDGIKEVLGIYIGKSESSKFWLSVLNEIKNRGVKDILIMCADGLTGMKESIAIAFPNTEYQRCIVHQIRNTLKYVSYKDRKKYASDLREIYTAPSEERGYQLALDTAEKWNAKYKNSMKSWIDNWDVLSPIFKFSPEVRKVIYTTNAIESLNSSYKRLNRQRTVFPTEMSLLKALFLSTKLITKKWSMPLQIWGTVHGELSEYYPDRIPN